MNENNWVSFGKLGRAHGLHGALRFFAHHDESPLLTTGTSVQLHSTHHVKRRTETPQRIETKIKKVLGNGAILFEGILTRGDAEKYTHYEVFISRELFEETPDDEYYYADLIGLSVLTPEKKLLGVIQNIEIVGPQTMAVVQVDETFFAMPKGESALIPLVSSWIRELDIESKEIVLELPEGLLNAQGNEKRTRKSASQKQFHGKKHESH